MSAYDGPKTSEFKVWHIPQIPGRAFVIEADTLEEARRFQDVLAFYDLFQLQENIKPDYSNVSGIMEWNDLDGGEYRDIDEDELEQAAPSREDMPWYQHLIATNIENRR